MTSKIPSETRPQSRRAMLAGALGGIGALVAGAVVRPTPAHAADGEAVVQGAANNAGSLTTITNTTAADFGDAFRAIASAGGYGVIGDATSGIGVRAHASTGWGAYGTSDSGTGVRAHSNTGIGLRATSGSVQAIVASGAIGVEGTSTSVNAWGFGGYNLVGGIGVWGQGSGGANNRGVAGFSDGGVGVYAEASGGVALRAVGRARFSTSGVATIAAGTTSKLITPGVNIEPGSFVLLTPKANIGSRALWFTTDSGANTFRIRMSSSRSSNTPVAWLLLG